MSGASKIRAMGPWVWVKPDPRKEYSDGGIFMPETSLAERTGLGTAYVISAGPGGWGEKGGKQVWVHSGIKAGDRVVYRHYLNDHAPKRHVMDDHCFIHMTDVVGFRDS